MKNIRIKSRIRFTTFILLILLSLTCFINYVLGTFNANGYSFNEYKTITVSSGDTLWSIAAREFNNSNDLRKVVYCIKETNNLKDENIEVGQRIKIPEKV